VSFRHIAVVGSGISGLSAAWLISRTYRVTLFESESWPGGHANTVNVDVNGQSVAVDTGFIVFNPPAYPNLTALFAHLGVPTAPSAMGFSVSMGGGAYEYGGANLFQLLGHAGNLVDAGHWRLIRDIPRFFRSAPVRIEAYPDDATMGQFLEAEDYSRYFVERHLLPMAGAIWSAEPLAMRDYPARAFLRFFENHGLLQLTNRPQWRTVHGGSQSYVSRLIADGGFDVRLKTPVRAIRRTPHGVSLRAGDGSEQVFSDVVIATHADQALAVLSDVSPAERALLSAFRYTRNRAILHRDDELMPKRRRLWSSWNYMSALPAHRAAASSVTYWMNALQPLNTKVPLFVSINPLRQPENAKVLAEFDYAHPVFDTAAMSAQRHIWQLQGLNRTWFCGAHFGSGFHEDGLQAGLAVAEQLAGAERPWQVPNASGRIHARPAANLPTHRQAAE
jgi:predicted NAD/FAD-binding protein